MTDCDRKLDYYDHRMNVDSVKVSDPSRVQTLDRTWRASVGLADEASRRLIYEDGDWASKGCRLGLASQPTCGMCSLMTARYWLLLLF